jgi:aminoglycoside phosphotransferase (APT) family kinase protein
MTVDAERSVPGIDAARVTQWIASLPLAAQPPLSFTRFAAGRSNLTYAVRDAVGRRWVLRRPPTGELISSAHDVAREHGILRRLGPTDVPAPRALGLCADAAAAPLLLMEHVDGVVLEDEDACMAIPHDQRRALGGSLMAALAHIHAVDLERSGLAGLASHAPYALRQVKRWRRQWHASRLRHLPAVDILADRLERAAPGQRGLTLVHGDYHLGNVIVDPSSGEVRAVLDWELCTLGDPLADLGSLLVYWQQEGDVFLPSPFSLTAVSGFATHDELIAAYVQASGRDVAALPYWHALGCWKIAVIFEGIRRRRLERSEPEGSIGAVIVDRLVARAFAIADGADL